MGGRVVCRAGAGVFSGYLLRMSQHDGSDYYVVVPVDSPFAVSGLAECVSGEWYLSSARAEAVLAHIVRPSEAVARLPAYRWVIDPSFFVGLLRALTAAGLDTAAPVWHDLLREAAGHVDDALLVVAPDHVLATRVSTSTNRSIETSGSSGSTPSSTTSSKVLTPTTPPPPRTPPQPRRSAPV